MSTQRIAYREFRADLADVLNRIEYRDEEFVVTRRGKPVAVIGPHNMRHPAELRWIELTGYLRSLGSGRDQVGIGDLLDYMQEIHNRWGVPEGVLNPESEQ